MLRTHIPALLVMAAWLAAVVVVFAGLYWTGSY